MGQRTQNTQQSECRTCGKTYTYRPTKNDRERVYCSRRCFNARATKRETRTCLRDGCSNSFEVMPSIPKKYCSRGCFPGSGHHTPKARPCSTCDAVFEPTSSRQRWCSTCVPGKVDRHRLTRYGLTRPQWDEMVARYNGKCWICKAREADAVDHDHATGEVRGALCRTCNMVLHYVEHPDWWDDAKAYLAASTSAR